MAIFDRNTTEESKRREYGLERLKRYLSRETQSYVDNTQRLKNRLTDFRTRATELAEHIAFYEAREELSFEKIKTIDNELKGSGWYNNDMNFLLGEIIESLEDVSVYLRRAGDSKISKSIYNSNKRINELRIRIYSHHNDSSVNMQKQIIKEVFTELKSLKELYEKQMKPAISSVYNRVFTRAAEEYKINKSRYGEMKTERQKIKPGLQTLEFVLALLGISATAFLSINILPIATTGQAVDFYYGTNLIANIAFVLIVGISLFLLFKKRA